jgi:GR25 family glycosyltransferase involved in LPS biosynthesis
MKVGINVHFQHSFFSSGSATIAFSLAAALKKLGHTPVLVNLNGSTEWYDDVKELKELYEIRNILDCKDRELDIFVDIDGYIKPSERFRITKNVVVFLRKPIALNLLESTVYPMSQPVQNIIECHAIWTWEHNCDTHLIEVLTKKPVIKIPFTWCPLASEAYGKNVPTWNAADDQSWEIHTLDSNISVASNLTLPITALAYAHGNSSMKFNKAFFHNSDNVHKHKFFNENVESHCKREGLEHNFVGRIRTTDLRQTSKSIVLSHLRFINIKSVLLDCVWNGIPLIHNSRFLKDCIGHSLGSYYYDDNSILGIVKAMDKMDDDFKNKKGMFSLLHLEAVRNSIRERLDPLQHMGAWSAALSFDVKPVFKELTVGFSDVYDSFNYEYNFWTLLLNEAGRHMNPPLVVKGVKAAAGTKMDFLMFGPFGNAWKDFSCPKFHFTGENSAPVEGVMNIGFKPDGPNSFRLPLWTLYIDWFGANQERLVNPKTMPIDSVCKPVVVNKSKFCAFIVTNPTNPVRNEAFHKLSVYKKVDSAGRLFNNVGDEIFTNIPGGGGGELKKMEFLKQYKFCLTYENAQSDGYVTEKLLAAKAAGCVPIYWGARDVESDFAKGSFINMNDGELNSVVSKFDNDSELWKSAASKAPVDCDFVRGRLSKVAKLLLKDFIHVDRLEKVPSMLGAASTEEAIALGKKRGCITEVIVRDNVTNDIKPKLEKPNKSHKWNNKSMVVTCATEKYIDPLLKWLETLQPRLKVSPELSARVYLGNDVSDMNLRLLKSQYYDIEFYKLPTDLKVQGFPDLWEPQHFAWKLWIYQQLVQEIALENTLIWYMDAASVIVRWPSEWFTGVFQTGICMLEDPEQKNDQWCMPSFRSRLAMTPEELRSNQVVGGIMAFIGGAVLPWKVFTEAWVLGQQRDLIVGPKWAGQLPDGRPYGHRHDQSILSLLRLRRNVPTYPLYKVYNHESHRRCFKSGASLYIHRGDYKEHVNFADRIGEVHIINLARRPDRLLKFKENHDSWTKQVCLRPAYDGKALDLSPSMAKLFATNDFKWKKAIMGCALSHLSLWLDLAQEQPSCENYLILEDDVKFSKDWLSVWATAAKNIPEDYDVLYLGGVLPPNKMGYNNVLEPVNSSWSRIGLNKIFGQSEPSRYFHFCNYSYILSRKGAKKILEDITSRGYTTSADHMVCNRMDMKHYMLNTLVAGCYQDDDPKYVSSEFNNFNRVDSFDSDLWNNDERFSLDEIKKCLESGDGDVSLNQVLIDGRKKRSRIYTVGEHKLVNGSLLEYEWLNGLLGGGLDNQVQVSVDHEPLDCLPIFVCMKPHFPEYLEVFQRYKMAGKEFYAIHLSDEHASDPVHWYADCKHVFRPYMNSKVAGMSNVTIIPLGPYRSTNLTRELNDRHLAWSFYGTGWNDREAKIGGLKAITPNSYTFYNSWLDAEQLKKDVYSETCLNTLFMPCPPGQSVETFRFYESLEHGCIPLYVRDGENDLHFKFLGSHLPLVVIDSWTDVPKVVAVFLQKPELIKEYRSKLLTAWSIWKNELKNTISNL